MRQNTIQNSNEREATMNDDMQETEAFLHDDPRIGKQATNSAWGTSTITDIMRRPDGSEVITTDYACGSAGNAEHFHIHDEVE